MTKVLVSDIKAAFARARELHATESTSLKAFAKEHHGAKAAIEFANGLKRPVGRPRTKPVVEKVARVKKSDLAREIFAQTVAAGKTRKEIVAALVEGAGLSLNGVNTYTTNFRKAAGLIQH